MLTIQTTITAPLTKVWEEWNNPASIEHWSFASDDWAAMGIENNLRVGGSFKNRNYAKDGSMEFIFGGTYTSVEPETHLAYTLDDGRNVTVDFKQENDVVTIKQQFDPEKENSEDMQQQGWQGYLSNFKAYVESL